MAPGLVNTSGIEDLLRGFVAKARSQSDFDRLPIPYRAVATDMVTGNMVVFDRGDIAIAMRASMAMQAIQPLMKDLQDRHKDDPTKLQQEMFKLYREHKVNPFGGCWPLLIPMPVLFALFFVFQNTIELRGASFLWLPDLSRADPLYILPVLMGLSMYGLSKVGQIGMEPNPQMKMMLYVMPVMMTVLFAAFASGLNLYYTVSNLASIPQQWLLAKERLRRKVPAAPAPPPKKGKK